MARQPYPFKEIPLTRTVARNLIPEVLDAAMRRRDIVQATLSMHVSRGGSDGTVDPEAAVKKALDDLVKDGVVVRPTYSYYRRASK